MVTAKKHSGGRTDYLAMLRGSPRPSKELIANIVTILLSAGPCCVFHGSAH